jgi:hypothetical protein
MKPNTRFLCTVLAIPFVLSCVGCNGEPPGSSRSLGAVPMAGAFEASRAVISQFFSVESQDTEEGLILCRPEEMTDTNDRLLGGTPARNVARLQLRTRGKEVVAYVQVRHERQMLTSREMGNGHTYSGVPNEPPVDDTEVRKSTSWNLVRYEHERENAILDDIIHAINRTPTSQPTTRASTVVPTSDTFCWRHLMEIRTKNDPR